MERMHALESELSMCMDELSMLQSQTSRVYYSAASDFRSKLLAVVEKINSIADKVKDKPWLRAEITTISHAVFIAYGAVKNLDLEKHEDWKKVFTAVNQLNYFTYVIQPGVSLCDPRLGKICYALSSGTNISHPQRFKSTNSSLSRNNEMLAILSKVSVNLSALAIADPSFYSFLGTEGEKLMNEIILLLIIKM
jgi:hypothetical protein